MGDTGVACSLLGIDAVGLDANRQLLGSMLETFVLQELRRQASSRPAPLDFFHFRDRDDFEVDIVLEQGHSAVAGVEVKAAATIGEADLRGLRKLRDAAGERFVAGGVLYDGSATVNFGNALSVSWPSCPPFGGHIIPQLGVQENPGAKEPEGSDQRSASSESVITMVGIRDHLARNG